MKPCSSSSKIGSASGCGSANSTWTWLPRACRLSIASCRNRPALGGGSSNGPVPLNRWKLNTTSSAVSGRPSIGALSCQVTPSRMVNRKVVAPADSQCRASAPV